MTYAYQIKELEYAYAKETVLSIDAYSIRQGETIALSGANGSGKSTLLDLLAFLKKPLKGQIEFFQQAVEGEDHRALRRRVAYVQQKPYLFNLTVMDNVVLGLKLRGASPEQRLQQAEAVIEQCGIEGLLHRKAHELSGGEVQKVAIARALVLSPEVLILDEPFSHLDQHFTQELERLLQDIRAVGSQTVIFSSHEQPQAQQLADHICCLEQGRIVPAAELNVFAGQVDQGQSLFDTGKIKIHIPAGFRSGRHLAIESNQLVVSRDKLSSSMRNSYSGRIKAMKEEGDEIQLLIEAGEEFHAMISYAALQDLGINIGDSVWVSFKSTAVKVN